METIELISSLLSPYSSLSLPQSDPVPANPALGAHPITMYGI